MHASDRRSQARPSLAWQPRSRCTSQPGSRGIRTPSPSSNCAWRLCAIAASSHPSTQASEPLVTSNENRASPLVRQARLAILDCACRIAKQRDDVKTFLPIWFVQCTTHYPIERFRATRPPTRTKEISMFLFRVAAAALSLALATPAPAQPAAQTILVASFSFGPKPIHLAAGQPVTLNFVNRSGSSHDFTAKEFFASSRIIAGAAPGGEIELRGGQT